MALFRTKSSGVYVSIKALMLSIFLFASSVVSAENPTSSEHNNLHSTWNKLLQENVVAINNGHSTAVDYAAMKEDSSELQAYLNNLSRVTQSEFNGWEKSKQLAFLINAYNAWTVNLILTSYPDLASIKDLGSFFSSPWSKEFISLLGKTYSLDNVEHDLIRGAVDSQGKPVYNDPRIHFAVNCASIGCPALRAEAYISAKLEHQLEEQAVRFLSDTSRNYAKGNTLNLSSIFKWYGGDFEQGYKDAHSLEEFMLTYANALNLTADQQSALSNDKMKISFLDYDWDLNAQH